MEQVGDVPHALDLAGVLSSSRSICCGLRDLTAEVDDAVDGVDVGVALGRVGIAEELGLYLASNSLGSSRKCVAFMASP